MEIDYKKAGEMAQQYDYWGLHEDLARILCFRIASGENEEELDLSSIPSTSKTRVLEGIHNAINALQNKPA